MKTGSQSSEGHCSCSTSPTSLHMTLALSTHYHNDMASPQDIMACRCSSAPSVAGC